MAVVAPGFLLLIFLGIQSGLWLYGRTVAEQSAREAVSSLRVSIVGADVSSAFAAAQAQAEQYAGAVAGGAVRDPRATAEQVGDRVRVTVTGEAVSLLPGITLPVRGSAEGDLEQFQVDW